MQRDHISTNTGTYQNGVSYIFLDICDLFLFLSEKEQKITVRDENSRASAGSSY